MADFIELEADETGLQLHVGDGEQCLAWFCLVAIIFGRYLGRSYSISGGGEEIEIGPAL